MQVTVVPQLPKGNIFTMICDIDITIDILAIWPMSPRRPCGKFQTSSFLITLLCALSRAKNDVSDFLKAAILLRCLDLLAALPSLLTQYVGLHLFSRASKLYHS